jgi:hypothetical protein
MFEDEEAKPSFESWYIRDSHRTLLHVLSRFCRMLPSILELLPLHRGTWTPIADRFSAAWLGTGHACKDPQNQSKQATSTLDQGVCS